MIPSFATMTRPLTVVGLLAKKPVSGMAAFHSERPLARDAHNRPSDAWR